VAGVNESLDAAQLVLSPGGNYQPFRSVRNQWRSQNGQYTLDYRRDILTNLQPRKTYAVELRKGDAVQADAEFTTLPDHLPNMDEKPLTILLASCFCANKDQAGRLGNTYFNLPYGEQPDVKIWCGDQVYLDAPWYHYTAYTHSRAELEVRHFENYLAAWSQSGTAQGFHYALKKGANYFTSDDHEFWNNAPNWTSLIRDSWSQGGRDQWWSIARSLFEAFQASSPVLRFTVGQLSFFIADSRINRDPDLHNFLAPADMQQLAQWVANLQGPGVLSLGQPLFATKAAGFQKITRRFSDWNLPDYDQFPELARILANSRHDLVMLTGDVHYGRVASVQLSSDRRLFEIISSPTALVDDTVGGKWHGPPERYPSFDVPGVPHGMVETVREYTLVDNHFLTLQFSSTGAQIRMKIQAWPVTNPGERATPRLVYEQLIQ
jgi:phosphodiesterase/alkaline phosphatase D-like protein